MATLESLMPLIPPLAEHYTVYAPERRGHGRSYDHPDPYTFDLFADEALAFMDAVGLGRCRLVGWSGGGVMGLIMSLGAPERFERFVCLSGQMHLVGVKPKVFNAFKNLTADTLDPGLADLLKRTAPDGPDRYPSYFERMKFMSLTEPNLTEADLADLAVPTLILCAQKDIVTLEHSLAMHRAIPGSRFGVLPGAGHMSPWEKPDLLAAMMLDFLQGDASPAEVELFGG
jgi:pimeloyl-ACP methyl ester carboxylesterase